MENYGKTLKKIPERILLTQVHISAEIMSQSNYSKVEKGEIDIPFSKMIDLLNRLGMSVDEFFVYPSWLYEESRQSIETFN